MGPRRRGLHRRRPIFPSVWFALIGINWSVLLAIALNYFRPHPLNAVDYAVGSIGILIGAFYLWVAYAVYNRRSYILNAAFACAGMGLLSFPSGTLLAFLLLANLASKAHDFTK